MNLNKVFICGNLTRDPELRYTPSGDAVANISLAINCSWKGKDGEQKNNVVFVSVVAWKRTAEVINQYVHKGDPLFVEGLLQLRSWDDPESGKKRSKMEVVAERIQLMGSKKEKKEEPAADFDPPLPVDEPSFEDQ